MPVMNFFLKKRKNEIGNVKDANSILVEIAEENMTLGHLEKNVAAVFAPLMKH